MHQIIHRTSNFQVVSVYQSHKVTPFLFKVFWCYWKSFKNYSMNFTCYFIAVVKKIFLSYQQIFLYSRVNKSFHEPLQSCIILFKMHECFFSKMFGHLDLQFIVWWENVVILFISIIISHKETRQEAMDAGRGILG